MWVLMSSVTLGVGMSSEVVPIPTKYMSIRENKDMARAR